MQKATSKNPFKFISVNKNFSKINQLKINETFKYLINLKNLKKPNKKQINKSFSILFLSAIN